MININLLTQAIELDVHRVSDSLPAFELSVLDLLKLTPLIGLLGYLFAENLLINWVAGSYLLFVSWVAWGVIFLVFNFIKTIYLILINGMQIQAKPDLIGVDESKKKETIFETIDSLMHFVGFFSYPFGAIFLINIIILFYLGRSDLVLFVSSGLMAISCFSLVKKISGDIRKFVSGGKLIKKSILFLIAFIVVMIFYTLSLIWAISLGATLNSVAFVLIQLVSIFLLASLASKFWANLQMSICLSRLYAMQEYLGGAKLLGKKLTTEQYSSLLEEYALIIKFRYDVQQNFLLKFYVPQLSNTYKLLKWSKKKETQSP